MLCVFEVVIVEKGTAEILLHGNKPTPEITLKLQMPHFDFHCFLVVSFMTLSQYLDYMALMIGRQMNDYE
jgi:hypothetical protein